MDLQTIIEAKVRELVAAITDYVPNTQVSDGGYEVGEKSDKHLLNFLMKTQDKPLIKGVMDTVNVLQDIASKEQEHFVVLALNGYNQVINKYTVSIGIANRTIVHPREVFAPAIVSRAVRIIMAHNHPSGNCEASHEDLQMTGQMKKAGDILGIQVLDHVIVSKYAYNSALENMWL